MRRVAITLCLKRLCGHRVRDCFSEYLYSIGGMGQMDGRQRQAEAWRYAIGENVLRI